MMGNSPWEKCANHDRSRKLRSALLGGTRGTPVHSTFWNIPKANTINLESHINSSFSHQHTIIKNTALNHKEHTALNHEEQSSKSQNSQLYITKNKALNQKNTALNYKYSYILVTKLHLGFRGELIGRVDANEELEREEVVIDERNGTPYVALALAELHSVVRREATLENVRHKKKQTQTR